MKSSYKNKYEVKFLVLGYDNVGKKSFAKRLKSMNSSETKQYNIEFIPPTPEDIKKILFSKENTYRDHNEIIQSKKIEHKIAKLCAFKKIFTIEYSLIEFSVKIIKKPLPILISDTRNVIDELENTEKQHNLKFNTVKKDLSDVITETAKTNIDRNYKTIFVFLFLYDLGNFDSFEKIKFYYEEICKFINLRESNNPNYEFVSLFVGNKIDLKISLPKQIKEEYVDRFFNSIPFKNYEISTASYFNIERFFKKIFTEVISSTFDEDTNEVHFVNKLDDILFKNHTFAKAEKHKLELNGVPGPEYDQEIFSVTADDKFNKAFSAERFKYKTFMNKTGPIISLSKDHMNLLNKKNKSKSSKHKGGFQDDFEAYKKTSQVNNLNTDKPNAINNKQGFTLGVKPSQVNYKKHRRSKLKEINNELNDIFKTNIVFYKDKKKAKKINIENESNHSTDKDFHKKDKNSSIMGIKTFFNQKSSKRNFDELYKQALDNRKELEKEKLNKIKELKDNQQQQYEEYVARLKEVNENRKRISASRPRIKKTVTYPKLVDVSKGFINEKTKFTLSGRNKVDFTYNKYDPSFRKIESDIEYKMKHPNLSFPKAERFAKTGLELKDKLKDDYMSQTLYYIKENDKLNQIKELKNDKQYEFVKIRRTHRESMERSRERNRLEIHNPNKNMTHDTPGPGAYFPEYNQVEENAPSYTLKGKLKSELFEVSTNYNDPTKLLDYDSNLNVLPNLPDFNLVKDNFPRVIFPKYPRFPETNNMLNTFTNFKGNNANFEPDKTGFETVVSNNDRNKTFYMGKGKRFINNIDNSVPGPNQYKLPGFTDEVLKKAMSSSLYSQKQFEKFHNTGNQFNKTSTSSKINEHANSNLTQSYYDNMSANDMNDMMDAQVRKSTTSKMYMNDSIDNKQLTKNSIHFDNMNDQENDNNTEDNFNHSNTKNADFRGEENRDIQEGEVILDTNNNNYN